VIFLNADEILDNFFADMVEQGYTPIRCEECYGVLWLEGTPSNVMLMRYATCFDGECLGCVRLKKVMC